MSIAQEDGVLGMSILDESVSETTLLQSLRIDIADLFPNLDDFGTPASSNTLRASDLLTEGCEVAKGMVYHNFSVKHRLLVAQGWCSFADFAQFVVDHLGFLVSTSLPTGTGSVKLTLSCVVCAVFVDGAFPG